MDAIEYFTVEVFDGDLSVSLAREPDSGDTAVGLVKLDRLKSAVPTEDLADVSVS